MGFLKSGSRLPHRIEIGSFLAIILVLAILTSTVSGQNPRTRILIGSAVSGDQSLPIREYPIPLENAGPLSIAKAQDGSFWIAEFSAGQIAHFFPSNGTFRQFGVPENHSLPAYVTLDQSGRVWFSDQAGVGGIWMFDPATGVFTIHRSVSTFSSPVGVALDASGNVWFAEDSANALGELVYPSYTAKEFPLPQPGSGPAELAIQPGQANPNVWITESLGNRIAVFNATTGIFDEFGPSVPFTSPVGIALDRSGNIWVSEHGGSSIVRLDRKSGNFTYFPTSTPSVTAGYPNSAPATLVIDGQGRLWFVEHFSNKVGRLDPSTRTIDEFQIPSTGVYSVLSALDGQGNFWFTEFSANKIGTIPGNASVPLHVKAQGSSELTLAAGGSGTLNFQVTNDAGSNLTVQLGVTSSFGLNGGSTPAEVSVGLSSLRLAPGKTEVLVASVSPDSGLSSGTYSVGLVAQNGNKSSVGIAVIRVTPNVINVLLYQTLPDALTYVIFVLLFGNIYVWMIRRRPGTRNASDFVTKASLAVVLALVLIRTTPVAVAKCPGLPGIGSQFSGPNYLVITFEVAELAAIIVLAYFLVRGIRLDMKERKTRAH